jgi:addiction module HigA family antidote
VKSPSHPGDLLKRRVLPAAHLSVTEAARKLGITRQTLNNLVNRKSGVSAEIAVRLSLAFGSTPEFWLAMQANYDLAQIRASGRSFDIERVETAGPE